MADDSLEIKNVVVPASPNVPGMELEITNDPIKKAQLAAFILGTEFNNSLSLLAQNIYPFGQGYGPTSQLSRYDTLAVNNRGYLISNNRVLLSQLYTEHGIVQTLVDQPVDDAFRAGFIIKSSQLDSDDIEKIMIYMERDRAMHAITQCLKWGRLFGGAAVLLITDQPPGEPFDITKVKADTPIQYRAVDLWELYSDILEKPGDPNLYEDPEFFNYYGVKVHKSRVFRYSGKEAPSYIRQMLRGWGMSEIERLVRSLNQYMKNQDVVFELMDEAKIDIYKISGFNTSLMNASGTQQISQRIQNANLIKNYNNAITMDAKDEYDQKTMAFTGLAEMLIQIRLGIAADLKMPVTKLFGMSAAGFSSGEDDIENYNSMIEGEVRGKVKFMLLDILQIACQKVCGVIPDDLMIEFPSLRILDAVQEEEVKNHQFNRVLSAFESGLIQDFEAKEGINKDSLLPIEIDETAPALPPLGMDSLSPEGIKVEPPKSGGNKE